MKKLAIILILSLTFLLPIRARAESGNWVALQTNTSGQAVTVSLNATLNTAINGASMILQYDPACYKVAGHQAGSLLPGATAFAQEQPGQLDLTYYYQGKSNGQTGEGSLIAIQLEALKACASDVSVAPESITLGVLDDKGLAYNLPGIEYRSLTAHLDPVSSTEAVVTPQQVGVTAVKSPLASLLATVLGSDTLWMFLAVSAALFFVVFLIVVAVYFMRSRAARPSHKTIPVQKPALVHPGGTIPLPRKRIKLGRHIEIVYQNGGFFVVDNGSRLGVFLNGNRLGAGYYPLRYGDWLQLGHEVSYQFVDALRENQPQR